jgi:transposase
MRAPDEVAAMLRLHNLGWGTRRIAAELGCDRETVRRYVTAGGWTPCRFPTRPCLVAGHDAWLAERLRRHCGNADVVGQELASELGIVVSLRTVERAVSHLRRELAAEALATVRFETPPGRQLQIDFGQRRIAVDGFDHGLVYLFVATLGYSRRIYVQPFRNERQSAWLEGIEGAFRHFGGLPLELLLDNAKALVKHHDEATREVEFNDRLHAFARYWNVRPVACAPYRARTIAYGDPSAKQPVAKPPEGARTSVASATSSTTLSRAAGSCRGARWKRTWPRGCARSPMCGCTARRGKRRSHGSSARNGRRCVRWVAGRHSGSCAS